MKLSTLILSKSAKNKDKKEYFPLNFVREFLVRKKAIFMKIRLDFKRGNSHALRRNSSGNAQRSVTQSVDKGIPTRNVGMIYGGEQSRPRFQSYSLSKRDNFCSTSVNRLRIFFTCPSKAGNLGILAISRITCLIGLLGAPQTT